MDSQAPKFNPLSHPICLAYPARLASTSWAAHVPFAMFIVSLLRPRTIVELGVYTGVSYCAFCQAVKELNLDASCYGIDNWYGDVHVGQYGPEILSDLKTHHDPLYENFSSLIQTTFDEAVCQFEDSSIDLLHIDGAHSYESVKNDFERWIPKMSRRGVMLLHDINVRDPGFGVWKLWDEIKRTYPHFEFTHEHGLGVISTGSSVPEGFQNLLELSECDAALVRDFFNQLGQRLRLRMEAEQTIQSQRKAMTQLESEVSTERERSRQREDLNESLRAEAVRLQDELSAALEASRQREDLNESLRAEAARLQNELSAALEASRQREDLNESLRAEGARLQDELSGALEASRQSKVLNESLQSAVIRLQDQLFASQEDSRQLLELYESVKTQVEERQDAILARDEAIKSVKHELAESDEKNRQLLTQLSAKTGELEQITRSLGWRVLSRYGKIKYRYLLPVYRMFQTSRELKHSERSDTAFAAQLEVETEPPVSFEPNIKISRGPAPEAAVVESDVRAIAFYLPQFHAIPENDKWWGPGFTEWTNVKRGEPKFEGHYQPHVPFDLHYYDLRDGSVLERQARLAREHGVFGFCFYYYWFKGKILLDLPIRRMMETGNPDFPFCVCWANENWTRRWDGLESEVLIGQEHSPEDDLAFLRNLEPILLHKNYIRIEGKPLLIIYRPALLPDARATASRWRNAFRERGLGELFIAAMQSFADGTLPEEYGFDASIQFPPHVSSPPINDSIALGKSFYGRIYDYNRTKRLCIDEFSRLSDSVRIYPCVMPSWDNTARCRNKSHIWVNSSPESYYDWLSQVTDSLRRTRKRDDRLVFINAWNEWAEGCHLEPDQQFGYGWLNATKLALEEGKGSVEASDPPYAAKVDDLDYAVHSPVNSKAKGAGVFPGLNNHESLTVLFVSHDAYPMGAQKLLLTLTKWLKETELVSPRFLLAGPGPLAEEFLRIGPVLKWDSDRQAKLSPDRAIRLLRSFCGKDLSAVYLNSAASGHVAKLTRHLNVPQIAHVHELEKSIQRWVGKEKMSALRNYMDLFIAASEPVAANLYEHHGIPRENLRVVHEFIRCTGIREISDAEKRDCRIALGLSPDQKLVLGCGTTDWRKGPDLFVQVAAAAQRNRPGPIQFIWVGGETQKNEIRDLVRLAKSNGVANNIRFVGAVPNPLPFMIASDIFLLPSREDPFPLVCLEAADCGKPIICFADAGGIPAFVGDTCGSVVPYQDIDKMADQLCSLLADDAMAKKLGAQAKTKVRSEFDVSVKGPEIYEILRALCKGSIGYRSVHV